MPGSAGTCGAFPFTTMIELPRTALMRMGRISLLQSVIPDGQDGARVPRRNLPDRPAGFPEGLVAANDGNITIRLDAERILATPTGVCKGMMHPADLIIVDRKGNKIHGRGERNSEI